MRTMRYLAGLTSFVAGTMILMSACKAPNVLERVQAPAPTVAGDHPKPTRSYRASLVRVIDGDTVVMTVKLGFRVSVEETFRLLRVDTPELRGGTEESKSKARKAREFVKSKLEGAKRIMVESDRVDSFGRYLAEVWYGDEELVNLNDKLLKEGLAVKYVPRSRRK